MKTLEKLLQVEEKSSPRPVAIGCLLDYPYFRDNYKMIAVDLSRQQPLDAHPRAIQQSNFTANLDREGNTRIYFILEESKETKLNFPQGTVKVL